MKKFILFFAACVLSMSGMYADTFKLVTDVSTLKDGDKVLLGNATAGKVSGGFSSNKEYLLAIDATFNGNTVTVSDPTVITLVQSNSNWKLKIENKPIGHKSGSNNFDSNQQTETEYTISISSGVATIKSLTLGKNSNELYMSYNKTDNPKRFKTYPSSSGMESIELYVLDEVAEKVPTSVSLNQHELEMRVGDADVTLTETVSPAEAVDKTVTWGSLNTSVATVVEGAVHAVSVGETKIWVKTNTAEKTDTCVVTVRKKLDMETVTYNAVQNADYLAAGAKVFIGTIKEDEDYVMSWINTGNNFEGVAATYGEKRHTVTAPKACLYTVERDGDKYLFVNTDGLYLRTASGDAMNCGANDQYAKWELGAFDEDNATVTLKAYSGKYLLNNYGYDWFRHYKLDADDVAQLVLYSDKAQTWVDRVKVPKMELGTCDVTKEGENNVIDYGKVDKWETADSDGNYWSLSKKIKVEYGDLSDNISISLTGTNADNFVLPIKNGDPLSDIESKDKKTGSYEFTIWFKAKTKGTYEATLTFKTATTGISDVVVTLKAEAIDPGSDPENQPKLVLSTHAITVNPNYENSYWDMVGFTYSATKLKKKLYVKWEHSSDVLFQYKGQNSSATILVDDGYVALNGSKDFSPGTDYTDKDVVIEVKVDTEHNNIAQGTYPTKLHFYSPSVEDASVNVIDEVVTINIVISAEPVGTGIDAISTTENVRKVFRDGQMIIIRNGVEYDAVGRTVR